MDECAHKQDSYAHEGQIIFAHVNTAERLGATAAKQIR